MAGDIFAFYASHSPMTEPGEASALIEPLPDDVAALARVIQGLGIYNVVARDFYGFEPPENRLAEIHLRRIADRLARIMELDDQPLQVAREPARRALQRCNSFALMLVAMLRAKGVPARSRCGFAAYFNPPNFEDHWVCEYWNAREERWILVDAQLDAIQRKALNITFNPLDVPRDRFIIAGDAWQMCRNGGADSNKFGLTHAHLQGLWFVAGNVIRDLASLNRMEMLPWDVWGAMDMKDAALTDERKALLDKVAALTLAGDDKFAEVRAIYESDERLRVPPVVFNALRNAPEKIAG